jgi:4-hydroxythreonine-4-phosphate dehydrogenase
MSHEKVVVGISIGDMNGIGLEVIIKTFADNRMLNLCTPVIYGSSKIANFHRKALNIVDFSFNEIKKAEEANTKRVNLINLWNEEVVVEMGKMTAEGGKYAVKSLKAATEDLASNKIDVLVTAPINKKNVQSDDFNFPGQTEFLAQYSNTDKVLMLMVGDGMRVAVATGHIPLKEVAQRLTAKLIEEKTEILISSLIRDFGIVKPRIAVLGLNPHAGDNGLLGEEEQKIIGPAIQSLKNSGHFVFGPYGSDGFFGTGQYKQFDGVMAMYHDQGLAPFKALAFDSGVNFTAGLPVVRTSPDHGTAMDIAGKNMAAEDSFRNAVYLACDIYRKRREYKEMTANPLQPQKMRD